MKIDTRLTRTHLATFTADDITSVAIAAVKGNVGISDDANLVSSDAKVGADGTVTVEIVESVPADAPAVVLDATAPVTLAAPSAPTIPLGIGAPPAA